MFTPILNQSPITKVAKTLISMACLVALTASGAAKAKAASSGKATGLNSTITETVPSSTSQDIAQDTGDVANDNDPNFTTSLSVVITTSETVISSDKRDLMADTGVVTATGTTEKGVLSTKSVNLAVGTVNAGALGVSGVNSSVTISALGVDSASSVADLSLVLKHPVTGATLVSLSATGLRSAASASAAGKVGAVTVDNISLVVSSEDLNDETVVSNERGIPPAVSGHKIEFPGGYVVLEEKILTGSWITVNGAHVFFDNAETGTHVDIIIGSAKASL